MNEPVYSRVEALLRQRGCAFEVSHHPPVFTSEAAAAVRGEALSSGAKALVCKADSEFVMFVLPGDRKLDSKRIRRALGIRALRFATTEELHALTGLTPGAVPPFGSLFGLPTHCDAGLAANEHINFNAGDHSISIALRYRDYLQVEQPRLGDFAAEPG